MSDKVAHTCAALPDGVDFTTWNTSINEMLQRARNASSQYAAEICESLKQQTM